jgi:DNA-binding NarL/FixJ family response regulator
VHVDVVAKATSPEHALELVTEHRPDLVLADFRPGARGLSGPTLIRDVHERVPTAQVIVLGESRAAGEIEAAFAAGAAAYVVKTANPDDVKAAIRQTFEPSTFLAPRTAARENTSDGNTPGSVSDLTAREREILVLVALGYTNKELAKALWVTEQTVKFHLSNVYRKLGVANRTEASGWAHRHGLVDHDRETGDIIAAQL